jgi:hypothetical protein
VWRARGERWEAEKFSVIPGTLNRRFCEHLENLELSSILNTPELVGFANAT